MLGLELFQLIFPSPVNRINPLIISRISFGIIFAPISSETGYLEKNIEKIGIHRSSRATKDLKEWMKKNELLYHSPHKFRHGHAVEAIKRAKNIAELKAISQNLMHSNLSITDGIYGIFSKEDRKNIF